MGRRRLLWRSAVVVDEEAVLTVVDLLSLRSRCFSADFRGRRRRRRGTRTWLSEAGGP